MRFEFDNMVLWFGTEDAPAPTGLVTPISGTQASVAVTVAVQPPSVSNTVQVVYRVNGAAAVTVNAAMQGQDPVEKVQYFSAKLPPAKLPPFNVGDQVEYNAVANAPGRQVPSPNEAASFPASFTVTAAMASSSALAAASSAPAAAGAKVPAPASVARAGPVAPAAPPATGATAGRGPFRVDGYLFFENGLPATGVMTRVYNRGFGDAATKLGEILTDVNGYYSIAYNLSKPTASLEVRALDAKGAEVVLCDTRHGAEASEVLNLVAPMTLRPVEAEYQRLAADIKKELGSLDHLGDAKETEEQQDLSLISSTTGWDPRLVALAATAGQLTKEAGLPAEVLYGLFRAGLPLDKSQLARSKIEEVEAAFSQAAAANIIQLDSHGVTGASAAFQKFATATLHECSANGTVSSFKDLLAHCGLTAAEQSAFEAVYFSQGSNSDQLWEKVEASGISKAKIDILRLQGKLFYLTLNNAPLVADLQKQVGKLDHLAQLAEHDLFQPEHWKQQITALAKGNEKQLAALIPSTYGQDSLHERLDAYAGDLARRIRTSFPTAVIARMIETHQMLLGGKKGGLEKEIASWLRNAVALGFELGRTPIESFVRANQDKLFGAMKVEEREQLVLQVKRLSRLFQITPSDESLKALLESGMSSAHDVTRIPYEHFIARFAHRFPSLHEAELVYRKAHQVQSTVLSHFSMAKSAANSPGFFATSPHPSRRQASKDNLVRHFPNMESLLGSLDYCQCSECRSVLSPAAYLVDLLQFLDPHPSNWKSFLEDWQSKHNKTPYPFQNQSQLEDQKALASKDSKRAAVKDAKTPYEVLCERRPDIAHLPLTCENTNVAMPYIDIVNEILEYFVVHDALTADSGHDTASATTEELLAEPFNILPLAYDKLRQAKYPVTLPFNLWLETVRHFVTHFDVKFSDILEIFRPVDELYGPTSNPRLYSRADVFAESLGLSPEERALLTDSTIHGAWYALYGFTSANDALAGLTSAKAIADTLLISYKELIEIIGTWFVNPDRHALVVLEKLEADLEEVVRYKTSAGSPASSPPDEKAAFEKHISQTTNALRIFKFDLKQWLDKAWQEGQFKHALILANTGDPGNFDQTVLTTVEGTAPDAAVLLRLNLFVRLWRRLGWTVRELDRSLQVAIPKDYARLTLANSGAALKTALLYLAHFKTLEEHLSLGAGGRMKLPTLWSNLATAGKDSLYAVLFLRDSSAKSDPDYRKTFDDPLGNYLAQTGVLLKDHLVALQAAISLSAADIALVFVDTSLDLATVPLSLDSISLVYRYGLLARALHISVADLIALKALTGLNPFQALAPAVVTTLGEDYPYSDTVRFVETARIVNDSGFKIEDLNYLLRHQFDPLGKYRQNPAALLSLVKLLATGIRAIQTEQAVPSDPTSIADELLQQTLALVLPANALTTFMAMWNGTVQNDVLQSGVAPGAQLDPTTLAQWPSLTLDYDPVLQAQKLSAHGFLNDAQAAAVPAANPSPILAGLIASVQALQKSFYDKYVSAFLALTDYQTLFTPAAAGAPDDQVQSQLVARRLSLAKLLFPYVQQQLIRQFVIQTLTTNLGADPSLVQALLVNPRVLADPKSAPAPLLDSFVAAGNPGVDGLFFASNDGSGAPLNPTPLLLATADSTNQKPAGSNSLLFQGYFEVPVTGAYRLLVHLGKQGAQGQLILELWPSPIVQGIAANDGAEISQALDLKAGIPYAFTFTAGNLGGGDASLWIQGESLPKNALSQLTVYARSAVQRVDRARILLAKTFSLIDGFQLDERELRYLLTNAADFGDLSFSQLPAAATDPSALQAPVLFAQFLRLAGYAKLKGDIASGGDDLIGVFENAQCSYAATQDPVAAQTQMFADVAQRVADLTRRDLATVQAAALQLGMAQPLSSVSGSVLTVTLPSFRNELGLNKLWRALGIAHKLGVSLDALARWATPTPDARVARDLRHTLKARYQREDWLVIAPPIFDRLRKRQRDALVAYIIERNGFEDRDQLFEYFLVDPGMEPIVQTSRLRLAISAIQTFVQRCLLNLEPEVQPSAVDAKEWEWMKRYRVWQANREIFLFPENWLEPEFRDDKTDLFQELEGTLLQGDITDDSAEDALFTYLKKLEEIARLEIVSIYVEQDPLEADSNVLHVIGRTYSDPRKYFYRTYEHQMWTPWESVTAQVDGDHVAAVIWRNRLNLFSLTFVDKAKQSSDGGDQQQLDPTKPINLPSSVPCKEIDVQLSWSEYYQGKWSERRSSGSNSPLTVTVDSQFEKKQAFVHATTAIEGGVEVAFVNLHFDAAYPADAKFPPPSLSGATNGRQRNPKAVPLEFAFKIISKNAPPQVVSGAPPYVPPFAKLVPSVNHYQAPKALQVTYVESIKTVDKQPSVVTVATESILTDSDNSEDGGLLTLSPTLMHDDLPGVGALITPFFYQDSAHVFYVEPSFTETIIDHWDHWAIPVPQVATGAKGLGNKARLVPSFPRYISPRTLPNGVRPFNGAFGPGERYHVTIHNDGVTDKRSDLHFGGRVVGSGGGKGAVAAPAKPAAKPPAKGARR